MLGERAMELIRETARTRDGGAAGAGGGSSLGAYNEEKVRAVLDEMNSLYAQNEAELRDLQLMSPAVHLRHAAIERNKRCLAAYVNHRAERVCEMRWQFGAVLPPEVKQQLCEREAALFKKYSRDLAAYMRSVGDGAGMDLMSDLHPLKSLYVEVRCVQDYGEMETDEGDVIVLKRDTQHFLPRALCEPLIRQGVLKHVTS